MLVGGFQVLWDFVLIVIKINNFNSRCNIFLILAVPKELTRRHMMQMCFFYLLSVEDG
jgi:hypothetical protein